jgi:lipoprotein NlpI
MSIFRGKAVVIIAFVLINYVIASICFANNDQFVAAIKLYDEGKYAEAINAFKEILNSIENRAVPDQLMSQEDAEQEEVIHNYLGKIYKIQGKYDLALKEFNKTVGMTDSADSCASYFIGEVYYLLEDKHGYPAAYWDSAVQESFDTECLFYAYIMHYIVTKASDAKKANELLENPPWKLKNNVWLQKIMEFLKGKVQEKVLLKKASTTAQKVFTNYLIGKKYIMDGKTKEAKNYFKKAMETHCLDCIGYDLAKKELSDIGSGMVGK